MKCTVFMSIKEAAGYLGIPKTKVYTLANTLDFPAKRVGKTWMIHRQQLEEWSANLCKPKKKRV